MDSGRLKGIALTTVGVLVLSPDALLIRLIDTDLWTMVFWRNLFAAVVLHTYLLCDRGRQSLAAYLGLGRYGLAGAACFGAGAIFFVAAIQHTSTANAMAIVAAAPVFAALFSLALLRERVAWRTWLAIACCLLGIGVIFSGDLAPGRLLGNAAAVGAAACMAGMFICLRAAPLVDSRAMLSLGGFVSAAIIGLSGPLASIDSESWRYLLILGLFVVPVSFVIISHGPRYISAAEVSLIMLLELVIAPWLVWLVLGETPSASALAGGGVILVTLTVYYLESLSSASRRGGMPEISDSTR